MRAAATLALVSLLVLPACGRGANATRGPKPVKARVVTVEHKDVRRDVESVGSLFPFEEVTVSSEVEGKVERVLVDVGDRVDRGQPLVKVLPVELELGAEQQRAAYEQTRARLGLAEGGADLGDPRDAAEVKRAQAALEDAQQKYQRAKSLFDEGLISKWTYDEAEANYKSARAAYDMARQSVENLKAELQEKQAGLRPGREEALRHRHPRALRRPGEGAHGHPGPVPQRPDAGDGDRGHRPPARAAQGAGEDGGLDGGGPAGARSRSRPTPAAASRARSRA